MSKEKPPRPPHIIQAIEDGDTALLSSAGRKGAMVTNLLREWRETGKALHQAQEELAYWQDMKLSNLHILDPDGESVDAEAVEERIEALKEFIDTHEHRKGIYPPEKKSK